MYDRLIRRQTNKHFISLVREQQRLWNSYTKVGMPTEFSIHNFPYRLLLTLGFLDSVNNVQAIELRRQLITIKRAMRFQKDDEFLTS